MMKIKIPNLLCRVRPKLGSETVAIAVLTDAAHFGERRIGYCQLGDSGVGFEKTDRRVVAYILLAIALIGLAYRLW
jgi:hypothetical protein